MICQKCGFMMDAFDEECRRCKAQDNQPAAAPAPGNAPPVLPAAQVSQPAKSSRPVAVVPRVGPAAATPPAPVNAYFASSPPGIPGALPSVNDSGNGALSVLPAELGGFNFGALFLSLFWSLAHSTWLGLLMFVPVANIVMPFVLGAKGNEWAWQNRRWESVEEYKQVQSLWMKWGLGAFALSCCSVMVLPTLLMSATLFPVFARARQDAERKACQSNLKQVGLALLMYSQDNADHYPLAVMGGGADAGGNRLPIGWADAVRPYVRTEAVFHCPSDRSAKSDEPGQAGYVDYLYNTGLGGIGVADVPSPANTFSLADGDGSDAASNATYSEIFGPNGAPHAKAWHLDGANYGFADGHVQWIKN